MINKFHFSLDSTPSIQRYDNVGAYNTLRALMNRGENLTIKFFTSKDNKPCAWIESRYVAGFKYELQDSSLHGLINYLQNGIFVDFDINPTATEPLEANSDFQMEIFKMFVNAGKALQYAPLFRTQPKFLSAMLPLSKGKIIFRVERTDDLLNYLREKKQESTLKSKACLKCLYFTKIISDLCRNLECFSYLYTINQTE